MTGIAFWIACIAGWMLIAANTAQAHTSVRKEIVCPYDGVKFTASLQGSGTSFGSMLDGMPYGAIITPWPLAICPTNGFVFFKDSFSEGELDRLKPFVLSSEFRALDGDVPYYRAAKMMEHLNIAAPEIASTLLRATWQAPPNLYRQYVKELLEILPRAIQEEDDPDKKDWWLVTKVELLRRTEAFEEAKAALDEAFTSAEEGTAPYLTGLYLQELIGNRDNQPHRIPENIWQQAKVSKAWISRRIPQVAEDSIFLGQKEAQFYSRMLSSNFIWLHKGDSIVSVLDNNYVILNSKDGKIRKTGATPDLGRMEFGLKNGKILLSSNSRKCPGVHSSFCLAHLDETTFEASPALSLPISFPSEHAAITHDGRYVVFSTYYFLSAYEFMENRMIHLPKPKENGIHVIASDGTGPRLLLATQNRLFLWDYVEERELWSTDLPFFYKSLPVKGTFSPNGKLVYVSFAANDTILLAIDAANGKQLSIWEKQGRMHLDSFSIDPQGEFVVITDSSRLLIFSIDLKPLEAINNKSGSLVDRFAFSPDGSRAAIMLGSVVSIFLVNRHRIP